MRRVLAPSVVRRQRMERLVCRALINTLLIAGYVLAVDTGEEILPKTDKLRDIMKHLFTVDQEHIYVFCKHTQKMIGWVFLVYGNDGFDVIANYTANLEKHMNAADRISDILETHC